MEGSSHSSHVSQHARHIPPIIKCDRRWDCAYHRQYINSRSAIARSHESGTRYRAVCVRVRTNARGMLALPAMRSCTQPRAPVLPINSRIARPGIRQLGVVTFRSVPPRSTTTITTITTTTTTTTVATFHRPSAFSTTSRHSPTSGDAASSIWRLQRTGRRGFPLRVSIHLVARYWSTFNHEERPFSKRPRCASARAYWSSPGHGTGFASVAGAVRTRR